MLQAISPRSPVYEVISKSGPEHEKTFVVRAIWEGITLGEGTGRSKKQAETAAAIEAMREKRWEKRKSSRERRLLSGSSAPRADRYVLDLSSSAERSIHR